MLGWKWFQGFHINYYFSVFILEFLYTKHEYYSFDCIVNIPGSFWLLVMGSYNYYNGIVSYRIQECIW